MINVIKKENCCGCGACAQVCPKHCISMEVDTEGFLYPAVDADACIHCGACERACPILRNPQRPGTEPTVYAAYALDSDIREASSSGGIFSLLANWVLENQGVVFGAAFDDDFSVHHVKVESIADMHKLRGSKYLQSRIETTYVEAETALEAGKTVLFSGVGCQIAGLKAYLKKDYENLYTVDVLCHGVPSPMVWQHYLLEQETCYSSETVCVSFRRKDTGWKEYSEEQVFRNGAKYSKVHAEDTFIQCFLSDICLRPSCHSCRFREGRSGADLTLGDAWGIQCWMPEMDDDRGTSVVLIHNEKGQEIWDCISKSACVRAADSAEVLKHNSVYYKSVSQHPNRKRFFSAMKRNASMAELERLSRKPLLRRTLSRGKSALKSLLKKIGIL